MHLNVWFHLHIWYIVDLGKKKTMQICSMEIVVWEAINNMEIDYTKWKLLADHISYCFDNSIIKLFWCWGFNQCAIY